jgi:hypothetical protein
MALVGLAVAPQSILSLSHEQIGFTNADVVVVYRFAGWLAGCILIAAAYAWNRFSSVLLAWMLFREDVLDAYIFDEILKLRLLAERWPRDYNHHHPPTALRGAAHFPILNPNSTLSFS